MLIFDGCPSYRYFSVGGIAFDSVIFWGNHIAIYALKPNSIGGKKGL